MEQILTVFRAITACVSDLRAEYGKKQKSLQLYDRLISRTQISNDEAIQKHILAFRNFCIDNREAIINQDDKRLVTRKVIFTEKIYIDFGIIFGMEKEAENLQVIWRHLLVLSAFLDPEGGAKEILSQTKNTTPEQGYLNSMMEKAQSSPDIMSLLPTLMAGMAGGAGSSREMPNLPSGMDVKSLMGLASGMLSNLEAQAGDDPKAKQATGIVRNIIGEFTKGDGKPNVGVLMTGIQSLLSNMGGISEIMEGASAGPGNTTDSSNQEQK